MSCPTTLASQAVRFKTHPFSNDVFEVSEGNLYETTLFRERRIAVQDAGSQLIPHLLDLKPSDVCLDLCAGVGGKSSQMARLKGSSVTCLRSGSSLAPATGGQPSAFPELEEPALGYLRRNPPAPIPQRV